MTGIEIILLITIDTLRYDAVAAMERTNTVLNRFEEVENAFTPCPLTLPAHASIFTGQLPSRHGLINNGYGTVDTSLPWMPDLLKKAGYRTSAVVSSAVLAKKFGLDRGFDTYAQPPPGKREREADETMAIALDRLRGAEGPLFLWLHLYDPHAPYMGYGSAPDNTREAYYAEVRHVDAALDRLWRYLQSRKLWKRTMVVLTADHGEDLGDHGEYQHGIYLYQPTTKIPLFIHAPGKQPHVSTFGSLLDLFPTILSRAGIAAPPSRGTDLFGPPPAHILISTMAPREILGWPESTGVVTEKLFYWRHGKTEGLYRLTDRRHTVNLADRHPKLRDEMEQLLPGKNVELPRTKGDPSLLSLGYLHPVNTPTRSIGAASERAALRSLNSCYIAMEEKRFDRLAATSREGLKADPSNPALTFYLATSYTSRHMVPPDSVIAALHPGADPSGATAYLLAQVEEWRGRSARSIRLLEMAIDLNPSFADPYLMLAMNHYSRGRVAEARAVLQNLVKSNAGDWTADFAPVIESMVAGRTREALQRWRALPPTFRNIPYYNVAGGFLLVQSGDLQAAMEPFGRAWSLGFRTPSFLLAYAALSAEIGAMEQSRDLYSEFVRLYPDHREVSNIREILRQFE